MEPEPDLKTGSGSNQKVLAPTGTGSATLAVWYNIQFSLLPQVAIVLKANTSNVYVKRGLTHTAIPLKGVRSKGTASSRGWGLQQSL